MVWRLLGFLRPYTRWLLLLFVILVLVSVLNISEPVLMGKLTSAVFTGGRGLAVPRPFWLSAAEGGRPQPVEIVIRRPGGFDRERAALVRAVCQGEFTHYGRLYWRTSREGLHLRLESARGHRLPDSLVKKAASRVAAVAPGTALYRATNVVKILLNNDGGFTPAQAAEVRRISSDYLGDFGWIDWTPTTGGLALQLWIPIGRQLQENLIGAELARRVTAVAPGTEVYPRLRIAVATGWVLFSKYYTVFLVPVLLLVVLLLKTGAGFAQMYLSVLINGGALRDVRNRLYAHLNQLSIGFFERQRTGHLMSRITSDVSTLHTFLAVASTELLSDLLTVALGVGLAFRIDWRLAVVTLAVMAIIAWPVVFVGRSLRRVGSIIQDRWADLTGILQETLSGVRVIKAFQLEGMVSDRFDGESDSVYRATLRGAKLAGFLTPCVEFLAGLAVSIFVWYGAHQVFAGRLAPDQLFTFVFVIGFITNPVKRLGRAYSQVQHALAAADRVFELLDMKPQVLEAPGAIVLPSVRGEVRFESVSFAYGDGPLVLKEVDLVVEPGEILALVGPSGAGKTSLVNLIPRFYDPVAGRILLDGHDLRSVAIASLRAQLGIVPQETLLFRATLAENIAYGRPSAARAEIIAASKSANAHDFVTALPDGYETLVGERGQTLSGGQRQRIAIARALLRNPRVLILDEATSSLDAESEALVQDALEHLMRDRTTFIIAHRLSTVRRAIRLAVISEGRLVELGTHDELIELGGVYARLYGQQFRRAGR